MGSNGLRKKTANMIHPLSRHLLQLDHLLQLFSLKKSSPTYSSCFQNGLHLRIMTQPKCQLLTTKKKKNNILTYLNQHVLALHLAICRLIFTS